MRRKTEIPNPSTQDVVTYDLVVNETAVDSSIQVLSISVSKEINRIPTAKIVFRDGEAADGEFAISDDDVFAPGNKIQIKIGRDRQNTTVFKGMIIKQQIKIREDGNAALIVECRDETVKMTIGRRNHYYEDSTDSEVIEAVIARNEGLTPEVEATTLVHKELVQHHCTDWDFLLSRAEVNGRIVVVDDGAIQVKPPNTSESAVLNVSYGSTLLEFEAEMDARTQWNSVKATSWDYTNQSLFEHTSDSTSVSEPGNISGADLAQAINLDALELRHSGQVLETELQQWTDAAMQKSRLAKICGRAKFLGYADLKPGQMIDMQGVGARFNGKAFISAVRHDVGNGSWDTHVQFGLPPRWFNQEEDIIDPPASGLLPAINGLQIGKVVQLQDDPDGEHRILVRLPIIDNQARGLWARIATLDAGSGEGAGRGTFFLPEIDDEVIVGFINDDPRDAVVLGMLHSSAMPTPLTAQDDNHEKGLVTRSDMRLLFDDDKKIITIQTVDNHSIVINEDEQSITITDMNDNTVILDQSGIALNSPSDITIEATGKIDIKATQDVSIEGLNVNIKANAQLEAQGQAGAKLSSSGIAEIQGSLVKIN